MKKRLFWVVAITVALVGVSIPTVQANSCSDGERVIEFKNAEGSYSVCSRTLLVSVFKKYKIFGGPPVSFALRGAVDLAPIPGVSRSDCSTCFFETRDAPVGGTVEVTCSFIDLDLADLEPLLIVDSESVCSGDDQNVKMQLQISEEERQDRIYFDGKFTFQLEEKSYAGDLLIFAWD